MNPYHYELPDELLAHMPAEPRDSARLLLVDTGTGKIGEGVFRNLAHHLPQGALLVMNDTKVVPARVVAKKESGGKVELLFLVNEWDGVGPVPAISDRKLIVGQKVFLDVAHICEVVEQQENVFFFKLEFSADELLPLLLQIGETPLPRYISKVPMEETWLRERYQSVLAERPASVAAPTASLHFTDRVFASLKEKGVELAKVTLHVGLGTFAPVTERELEAGKLHEERYEISAASVQAIKKAKEEGRPIVAVGTTVVRCLESAAQLILSQAVIPDLIRDPDPILLTPQCDSKIEDTERSRGGVDPPTLDPSWSWDDNKKKEGVNGETRLFIRPGYEFQVVDELITNFHLPESSLMYLVDAFVQYKKSPKSILEIYKEAIRKNFRFYSFGDAMLIQ